MKSISFLINPVSGGGIGGKVYEQLPEIMSSFGFQSGDWQAELTEASRLQAQVDEALNCSRRVIAVGGDGTIGFVLDRMRKGGVTAQVGLIPLGTGNDLGRTLGIFRIYIHKGLLACVKRLIRAPSTAFDLWDVDGNHTLAAYLSVGMDAAVLRDFDSARRQGRIPKGAFFNQLFYVKAFLRRIGETVDQGTELKILTLKGPLRIPLGGKKCCVIGNINSYAAGARLFPASRFDDGMLDVLVIDKMWKYAALTVLSRSLPRISSWLRGHLEYHHARSVELSFKNPLAVQLDGEDLSSITEVPGTLTIRPSASVRVLDLRKAYFTLF